MKTIPGWLVGLILLGSAAVPMHAGGAETYSMNEIRGAGTPPQQTKRVEPVRPVIFGGMSMGGTFYKYSGIPGRVTVAFIIDEQGRVRNARIVRFSNPGLIEPAIEAMRAWKYAPAKMNGRSVRVAVIEELGSDEPVDPILRPQPTAATSATDRQGLPPELQWDNPPVLVESECAVYPRLALQARQEGLATIHYVVDRGGRVSAAQVIKATTPEMGQAALAAIVTRVYTPPTKRDGTPCSALQTSTYRFDLNERTDRFFRPEGRKMIQLLEKNPGKIVPADKLDRPLKVVLTRAPLYPVALPDGRVGETDQAEVDAFIDTNGEVQLPAVAPGTPPELGYAAVHAVAAWRFDVPRAGGKPVVASTRLTVAFKKPASVPAQD